MTRQQISRRRFLQKSGTDLAAFSVLSLAGRVHLYGAAPNIEILETKDITHRNGYFGWPSVAIHPKTNELFVVASGGREGHVCPFGRVDFLRSRDFGETWTWPQTIYDGPTDDRDTGILVTSKGTILVTTFTSDGYYQGIYLLEKERRDKGETPGLTEEQFESWEAVHRRLTEEDRPKELGSWMIRSEDNGLNWSMKYRTPYNSPHGPIELSDGRLLYPGREFYDGPAVTGVAESTDDGRTWKELSVIPSREGDDPFRCHELHGVEAADGTIIVQIRNHNDNNDGETLQSESTDGGKTWSVPHTIGVWGHPSHLLRLRDNRLLMTYGYRKQPYGNQARLSEDNGKTWSEPITVYGGGQSTDLGYPSTVQLPDDSLVSVWYENSGPTCIRMARWKLT